MTNSTNRELHGRVKPITAKYHFTSMFGKSNAWCEHQANAIRYAAMTNSENVGFFALIE